MRTGSTISTISYNSESYLFGKLNELKDNHIISDYMFIKHYPEEDEAKEHFHVWIKPNKLLDTMDLQDHFKEYDSKNPKKPLGCIDFHKAKTDDWILYCQHYRPYLISKGQDRQYYYKRADFKFADDLQFENLYNHAFNGSEWAIRYQTMELIKRCPDMNYADLILNGTIPLQQAGNLVALQKLHRTYRGGRKTHTPKVDEHGVIIDE